jgi:hypothetical protein
MINKKVILFFILLITSFVQAQEFQSKVTVITSRVNTTVDKKIFNTLQTQLTNFINNRKWTNESFKQNEKIQCNFLLNIEKIVETNVYKASLTIQAARPVYNSSYQTAIINFQDADVTFRYVEFQPIEFNENRVQGNDPLAANLTAIFVYYLNVILGLDFDSFASRGGDIYYQKAQNIVNNAPENREINGWRVFDGLRNRYFLIENLMNSRYAILHDVIYNYYRSGMDYLYENENEARAQILQALTQLQTFNQENPNSMFVQFFMQGKTQELIKLFKKATFQEKVKAIEVLQKLDIANASTYKQEIK